MRISSTNLLQEHTPYPFEITGYTKESVQTGQWYYRVYFLVNNAVEATDRLYPRSGQVKWQQLAESVFGDDYDFESEKELLDAAIGEQGTCTIRYNKSYVNIDKYIYMSYADDSFEYDEEP